MRGCRRCADNVLIALGHVFMVRLLQRGGELANLSGAQARLISGLLMQWPRLALYVFPMVAVAGVCAA
jgi:hypothetical protein